MKPPTEENMARISCILRANFGNIKLGGKCFQRSQNFDIRHLVTSSLFCNENQVTNESVNCPRLDRLFSEIEIELRAHQPDVLKSYSWFASTAAKELDIDIIENYAEPDPYKLRKTLLKSVFANSKHRVQYEMRTYYHLLKVGKLTESTKPVFCQLFVR